MSLLPPIDAHAHIQTSVSARDVAGLRAFVVAVTRERKEWESALCRNDPLAVWGIGVHPGLPAEVATFDQAACGDAVEGACFVGEVGLDGKSKADLDAQKASPRRCLGGCRGAAETDASSTASPHQGRCSTLFARSPPSSHSSLVARQRKADRGSNRARLLLLDQRRRG